MLNEREKKRRGREIIRRRPNHRVRERENIGKEEKIIYLKAREQPEISLSFSLHVVVV